MRRLPAPARSVSIAKRGRNYHATCDEYLYVLSGRATFEMERPQNGGEVGLCCKDDRRRWEDGDKLDPVSFMRRYRKER
jgi:hypothetical protein